jgi:hypothetical protein
VDLINDDRPFQFNPTDPALFQSLDMEIAARTSLPVLISAPPRFALPMALEVALGADGDNSDGVVVVDAADDRYLQATLQRAALADPGRLRAIVVHDVDALDRAQQSTLKAVMGDMGRACAPRACRIIATTSVPLFDRVLEGSFDSGLFYHLNKIHINVSDRQSQHH